MVKWENFQWEDLTVDILRNEKVNIQSITTACGWQLYCIAQNFWRTAIRKQQIDYLACHKELLTVDVTM